MTDMPKPMIWMGIFAAVCFTAFMEIPQTYPGWKILFTCLTFLFGCTFVAFFIKWEYVFYNSEREKRLNAEDRQYMRAQVYKEMNDKQLAACENSGRIKKARDLNGVDYIYETNVPWAFLEQMLARSYPNALEPVRNYSDGSRENEWADTITRRFVSAGLCKEARGNLSAQFNGERTKFTIAEGLGIRLPHPDAPTPLFAKTSLSVRTDGEKEAVAE